MTKRRLSALVLLAILNFQWVGGRSMLRLTTLVQVEREMDEREAAIAEALEKEMGIQAHIKIQDEQQIENLQSLGYGAPFLFSHSDEDAHYYYTVEQTPIQQHDAMYAAELPRGQQSDHCTLLERFFSDFVFDGDAFTSNASCLAHSKQPLATAELRSKGAPLPGTPPPQIS